MTSRLLRVVPGVGKSLNANQLRWLGGLVLFFAFVLLAIGLLVAITINSGMSASEQTAAELIASALTLAGATLLGSGVTLVAVIATLSHERRLETERRVNAEASAAADRHLDAQVEYLRQALEWFDLARDEFFGIYQHCEAHANELSDHRRELHVQEATELTLNRKSNRTLRKLGHWERLIDSQTVRDALAEADGLVRGWNESIVTDIHSGSIELGLEAWSETLMLGGRIGELQEFVEEEYLATLKRRWGEPDAIAELPPRFRARGEVPPDQAPGRSAPEYYL